MNGPLAAWGLALFAAAHMFSGLRSATANLAAAEMVVVGRVQAVTALPQQSQRLTVTVLAVPCGTGTATGESISIYQVGEHAAAYEPGQISGFPLTAVARSNHRIPQPTPQGWVVEQAPRERVDLTAAQVPSAASLMAGLCTPGAGRADALVAALSGPIPQLATGAAWELLWPQPNPLVFGDAAAQTLATLAVDADRAVALRVAALVAIKRGGVAQGPEVARRCLEPRQPQEVQAAALDALGAPTAQTAPLVAWVLMGPEGPARHAAVRAASRSADPAVVAPLRALAFTAPARNVSAVCRALATQGSPQAVQALAGLKDQLQGPAARACRQAHTAGGPKARRGNAAARRVVAPLRLCAGPARRVWEPPSHPGSCVAAAFAVAQLTAHSSLKDSDMRMLSQTLMTLTACGLALCGGACAGGDSTTTSGSTSSGSSGTDGGPNPGSCNATGTTVLAPSVEAMAGGAAPDVGCFTTPVALGPSQTVTARGCVSIFGVGRTIKQGMFLEVYGIDQNPGPGGDTPRYGAAPDRKVPLILDPQSGCESQGRYEFPNLPTNTPLIFKTYDTETGPNKTAVDAYQYNVVLRQDRHDPDMDGIYEFEANMIFVATYTSIPNVAGKTIEGQTNVSDGVGRAALAGEVRDCTGVTSMANATVGGSCIDAAAKIVYFNGATDPQPDVSRAALGTNGDGLYSVVNVKASRVDSNGATVPGFQQEVEGKVLVNGTVLSAGKATVWVFPDSVTIFSPQGLLPTAN